MRWWTQPFWPICGHLYAQTSKQCSTLQSSTTQYKKHKDWLSAEVTFWKHVQSNAFKFTYANRINHVIMPVLWRCLQNFNVWELCYLTKADLGRFSNSEIRTGVLIYLTDQQQKANWTDSKNARTPNGFKIFLPGANVLFVIHEKSRRGNLMT